MNAWNSSFLPKQNKTTLCDRWLRVSENTLLLELTPCVFWLFRETLDFLLAIYSWFFEAVWIFLLFQFFKLFSLLDVNLLPRSVHLSPKSVHFLLPQKSLSVNRKLGVRGKESGKYKGGRSREARLNSLRRLGILREKQRIQQMPLHTLSIRKQQDSLEINIENNTTMIQETRLAVYFQWLVIGSQKWTLNLNPKMSASVFLVYVATGQKLW